MKAVSLRPIALNGRFSGTPQPTGTQTASLGLFDAIIRAERERPLVVFADPRFEKVADWAAIPHTTLVPVPFQDWSRRRAQIWEQFTFPRLSRRHGCVLAHHPMTTCPSWNNGLKSVVTLHDLNFFRHPEWYSRSFRLVYHLFAVPGLRRADRVVTISNYVRDQAIACLHLKPGRVRRIYNGVKPLPLAADQPEPAAPYLLCVGSLQPHKNLPRLIRAYRRLRADFPDLELRVVGRPQPRFAGQEELADLLQTPGVKLTGYLSEAELMDAYRRARVFCYPSLEEGFGLPLLEALQAGTLVMTSNVSCLPEIAGTACEQIDPFDEEAMAASIAGLLRLPPGERRRRVEEGHRWADTFSWQRAAHEYLKLYEEMAA